MFPGTFRERTSFGSDGNFAQLNEVPLPYLSLIAPSSKRGSLPNSGYSYKEPVDPRAGYPSFRLITTAPMAKEPGKTQDLENVCLASERRGPLRSLQVFSGELDDAILRRLIALPNLRTLECRFEDRRDRAQVTKLLTSLRGRSSPIERLQLRTSLEVALTALHRSGLRVQHLECCERFFSGVVDDDSTWEYEEILADNVKAQWSQQPLEKLTVSYMGRLQLATPSAGRSTYEVGLLGVSFKSRMTTPTTVTH